MDLIKAVARTVVILDASGTLSNNEGICIGVMARTLAGACKVHGIIYRPIGDKRVRVDMMNELPTPT